MKKFILFMGLLVLIVMLATPAHAERLPVDATGLWGVEGTPTTGMAIDVKVDTFAVLIFANDRHSRQTWFIAADQSVREPTAYALYSPDGNELGDEIGFAEFEYIDHNTIYWSWTIYELHTANDYCIPSELVNGVCLGGSNLFRITER